MRFFVDVICNKCKAEYMIGAEKLPDNQPKIYCMFCGNEVMEVSEFKTAMGLDDQNIQPFLGLDGPTHEGEQVYDYGEDELQKLLTDAQYGEQSISKDDG